MDTKKSLRRSVLKGALAAPAILTVRTASAQAAASNVPCIMRNAAAVQRLRATPVMTSVDADEWFRQRVDILELADLQSTKKIPGKFFLGADGRHFWKLNDGQGAHMMAAPTNFTTSSVVANKTGEVKYALVYVDERGNPTGFAWERRNGMLVANTCMASMGLRRAVRG